MRRWLPYLLVATLAVVLSGCSYKCHFVARGVVRNAADGSPIPNARVELLRADGRLHTLEGGGDADSEELRTNPQGEFQAAFWTVPSGKDELTGWMVKLSAEGYEPETIAVGPVKEPKRGDVTVYLVFHATLRKAR